MSNSQQRIRDWMRRNASLVVSEEGARAVLVHLSQWPRPSSVAVSGRDLLTGLPRHVRVASDDLQPPDAGLPVKPG